MLRLLLVLLVVANLAFFAFTRGWLDGVAGLSAAGDREPERLAKQVRPQTIRLSPIGSVASPPPLDASVPCYETPTFTAGDAAAVEAALAANLPAGSWVDHRAERNLGTRTEVTHIYRVMAPDTTLTARLATLRLDAAGRGFSFSPCARGERAPR
ncbi:MAG TPA: hypothetical protein VLD35_02650 [Caldimonas sp.]|nr:hypothetical protein [Caldimonas sp.]